MFNVPKIEEVGIVVSNLFIKEEQSIKQKNKPDFETRSKSGLFFKSMNRNSNDLSC